MHSHHGEGAGRPLSASYFSRLTNPVPERVDLAWPATFEDFYEVREGQKDQVPLWSPARFAGQRRANGEVVELGALVLDYDGDFDAASILAAWRGYECVLHSTYTPGSYRVVLPYARPLPVERHAAVWAWAKGRDARIDGACKDPARAYYLPTCRSDLDVDPQYGYMPGERLDVDRLPVDLRADPSGRSPPPSMSRAPGTILADTSPARGTSAYAGIEAGEQTRDWALIQSRCAFARHSVEQAATLSEPEWYAALGLVARCVGGDAIAHDISRPYPSYSESETAEKLRRAKQVGPPTCAHVRSISAACEGCPLAVTSAVLLGRVERQVSEEADPQEALREAREVYARARADEDTQRVALDRAKRALRAVRAPRSGASEEDIEAAVRAVSSTEDDLRVAERIRAAADRALKRAMARTSLAGLPPGADPGVWGRLAMGKDKPAPTVANCMLILGEDPKWSSRLSYDSFAVEVCLDREPLAEERATEITAQLGYDYGIELSTSMVTECVRAVARRRPFHPVREWLSTLRWDGESRLRDLTVRGLGALPSRDPDLLVLLVERFLLSILARAFEPGAKVDTMLVLVGAQGARKSTALETLVGAHWFGATKLDLANKDSFLQLRGKLLYEIGEMEGIKRADANVSKHWLSSRVDTYRAPYARRAEDHPRQTVMAGSTNELEILLDPTGFRRYWILPVEATDIAWIAEHRDQIWAEALALRAAGRQWWFDEGTAESDRLRVHTLPYQQVHPWAEVIMDWVQQRKESDGPFTATTVLRSALGQMVTGLSQSEATIVGTILRHYVGCPAERVLEQGRRPTLYRRPDWMNNQKEKGVVIPLAVQSATKYK